MCGCASSTGSAPAPVPFMLPTVQTLPPVTVTAQRTDDRRTWWIVAAVVAVLLIAGR